MEQRPLSFGQKWSQSRPSKTLVFWACVATMVATMIVGFTWGGWVTGGTARATAATMAGEAVAKRLAPMCVLRFKADAGRVEKLKELTDASTYARSEYVQKQGWATMPGEEAPDTSVADECAKLLVKAS